MPRQAGIPLLELFSAVDQVNSVLPQAVGDFFGRFAVIGHTSRRSPGAIIHQGRLQALDESLDADSQGFDVGIGTLSLPLIHTGLPFQLSLQRQAVADNLEPPPDAWQLDLFLADFSLSVDGLQPALFVEETGTTPRHLLRDPNNDRVRITGSAVLRLQKNASSSDVDFLFIDHPDPLDPTLQSGAVVSLNFTPPHFFLGSSDIGLSVGKLTFDFSSSYSPADVLERNQGPAWMGLAIREATVYAPRNLPVVGDLSGGVKDLLIGRPAGIQGEFELQFGRTAMDPATFQFEQQPSGDNRPVDMSGDFPRVIFEGSPDERVSFHAGFNAPAPPDDGSLPDGALQDWTAIWTWPGREDEEGDSSSGSIGQNQVLTVQPIEILTIDGQEQRFKHPPFTFRFVAAGDPPSIAVITDGGERLANVVQLNGATAEIETLTLEAVSNATDPSASEFDWSIEANGSSATGATFSPDLTGLSADRDGHLFVRLREKVEGEDGHRVARLHLKLTERPPLLIGCENGVFDATDTSTPLDLIEVEKTFDLSDFHARGDFTDRFIGAVLDDSPAGVSVPSDGLARVVIGDGAGPPPPEDDRHVQILMEFEKNDPLRWGEHTPKDVHRSSGADNIHEQLLNWAAKYPGADFLIVGRTDDLNFDEPGPAPAQGNITLARDRADKAHEFLTTPTAGQSAIDSSRIVRRGEHSDWDAANSAGDSLEESADIDLTAAEKSEAFGDAAFALGWLIRHQLDRSGWEMEHDSAHPYEPDRQAYRRADIYAVGGTPVSEAIHVASSAVHRATLRRSLVPAPGRDPAPVPPKAAAIDYRVKLRFVWDSPTVTRWEDAVPTLAEAEFAWSPKELPLPAVNGEAVEASRETLTIHAQWIHDVRTGFTRTTLGIRSDGDPDGLVSTDQKNLTAALAFGPMLLSGVDSDTDMVEAGARVTALIAAAAFADVPLGGGDPLVGDGSKTALIAVEAEAQTRTVSDAAEDYQVKLTSDYTCTLHVNGGALGIKTAADRPMKIRYKGVGFEFDNSKEGWDKVGLAFDTSSMEIEDPGKWEIDGVLGSLLRVVEVAMGRGSLWVEGRIAVALNIGVVEISEAIIRLTFEDGSPLPTFELRGFVLKADVPAVLTGEGRLRIEDGGVVRAGVDADIIPLDLKASAALALARKTDPEPYTFLSLAVGVQFSTPLPLLQTGAALYGMKGMFVMNGERDIPAESDDPVGRELTWWGTPPESKYRARKGQYALGVGVVVGTLPDVSFCFSASGMVVVGFPDPEVILGVDVKVIEVPNTTVSDEGSPEGSITGLIVIDDEAVTVAVSAQYEIPQVLKVKVPFGAYFPYDGDGTFVRLGCDGQTDFGRVGEPITLTLLPGTLDVEAWAYLMIEEGGLPSLGGDPRFSFDGFSVGFGAGWGIDWSAGPISLSASAKVLVGFGTKPLLIKGGVFVAGELDLVVLSISARGELILTYLDPPDQSAKLRLDGEFCGEVDLFFFSIKGCVGVSIGDDLEALAPPEPEPPIVSVSLTDRRDRIMGSAAPIGTSIAAAPLFDIDEEGINQGASPDDNHTVWPDTAPVLHFSHFIANGLGDSAQFDPGNAPAQPRWFGSNRLKYAYRLDSLQLRRKRDGLVVGEGTQLESVWMSSPYRQPVSEAGNPEPSEHEGPNLKLLDWNPWNWSLNLPGDDAGEGLAGDPAAEVANLCEPVPEARRACVFGRAATGLGWQRVLLRQESRAEPPYPSRFHLTAEPLLRSGGSVYRRRDLQTLLSVFAAHLVPGRLRQLPFPVTVAGTTLQQGYRLPSAQRSVEGGQLALPLPWEARFDRELARPRVTLLVCDAAGQPGRTQKQCIDFGQLRPSGKRTRISVDGIDVAAIDPNQPFTLTDSVDAERFRPGRDRQTDIAFLDAGIELRLPSPSLQVELRLMKFHQADIEIRALDANGRPVASDTVTGPQNAGLTAHLNAPGGIARVQVTGGGRRAVLFGFCFTAAAEGDEPSGQVCEAFRRLKPRREPLEVVEHGNITFTPLREGERLRLVDAVDQRGRTPVAGNDGSAEINFPASGLRIELPNRCRAVELWIMQFSSKPVKAEAHDSDGNPVASGHTPQAQRQAHRVLLDAGDDGHISSVQLTGGAGEAVLLRLCCRGASPEARHCIDFKGVSVGGSRVAKLEHHGVLFTDSDEQRRLRLVDAVDARPEPARRGRDGIGDLLFDDDGLRITLPNDCTEVSIGLLLLAGPVKGTARDALGARVDHASTGAERGSEQRLVFRGAGIRQIELLGGGGKALLFELCCRAPKQAISIESPPLTHATHAPSFDALTHDDPAASSLAAFISGRTDNAPTQTLVRGMAGEDIGAHWPGRVVRERQEQGRRCQVIEYNPASDDTGPWNGFQVIAPPGKQVSVLAVCGTDQVMVERRQTDAENRDRRRHKTQEQAGQKPEQPRALVLDPGEEYELEASWSWQAWQANDEGTNEPPATPPDDQWTPATAPQRFHFAIADEQPADNSPQDGLNEHLFDVRDISRHLTAVEPADGRACHFLDDALWVHFDAGHMEQLAQRYGRELTLEVRRTDPPPQPDPASLADRLAALPGEFGWSHSPPQLLEPGYRRINEAAAAAPCLPDEPIVGGASLHARFALEPQAMYDFSLIAPRHDASGEPIDARTVSATRFVTSRYANPLQLLEHLGYYPGDPAPYRPDDIILPAGAALPGGAEEVSDSLFDELLRDMQADTLPLPTSTPVSYVVWRQDGAQWRIEGLLVDSLEPLMRITTVLQDDDRAEIVTRCDVRHAEVDGHTLSLHRSNERHTRVFLKADSPFTLAAGSHELRLDMDTSGGVLRGRRRLSHRPAIIEREGF
ncbi:hypothetical protein LG302_03145 [Halomonas organivorans]